MMVGDVLWLLILSTFFGAGEAFSLPPVSSIKNFEASFVSRESIALLSTSAAEAAEEDDNEQTSGKRAYIKSRVKDIMGTIKALPVLPATSVALLVGYRLGLRATVAQTKTAAQSTASRFPIVSILLLAFGVKEVWFATPDWVKSNLSSLSKAGNNGDDAPADSTDLTSLVAMSAKLEKLFDLTDRKLKGTETTTEHEMDIRIPFLVSLRLMSQIKGRKDNQRDARYREEGEQVDLSNSANVLKEMDEMLEYADWAYDAFPKNESLRGALAGKGYDLFRSDKPGKPGFVSHYVAVNKQKKTVMIGVKGTSGLEDLLTDCCGVAVSHDLPGPYVKNGNSTIRCHEGIFLSSQRLCKNLEVLMEEFLLPTGYKIIVTGHSLGAGVAALVGVLLRARFPVLWEDESNSSTLRVVAFASPPILDCDAALSCEPFVTTVVNNADIIPRASLSNLVVLMQFLKIVDNNLEETQQKPKTILEVSQFILNLAKSDDMAMSLEEVKEGMDAAYDSVELRDPDHLYVPGKVVHMFDLWCKNEDESIEVTKDVDVVVDSNKLADAERTAQGAVITNGTSKMLRHIELDVRFLPDHLTTSYRSSIRGLIDQTESQNSVAQNKQHTVDQVEDQEEWDQANDQIEGREEDETEDQAETA